MKNNNYLLMLPVVATFLLMSIVLLIIHFIAWSPIENQELRFHLLVFIASIAEYIFYLKTKA